MFSKSKSLKKNFLTKLFSTDKTEEKVADKQGDLPDDESEADREFVANISSVMDDFIKSNKSSLDLEPMNSYFRHLAHQIAHKKKLFSSSFGVREKRHLVIYKRKPSQDAQKSKPNQRSSSPPPRPVANKKGRERFSGNPRKSPRTEAAKEYLVPISKEGIEVIIDQTGYIGIRNGQTDEEIVDVKTITSGSFTVVDNKIRENN